MIITGALLIFSLALVWACRTLPPLTQEPDMYHMMSPERAADQYAEDLTVEEQKEMQHNTAIDMALEDFIFGVETPPMDYEFVEDEMIDNMHLFQLIQDAWRNNDYTRLGEDIRQELLLAAERQADTYRR